MLGLRAVRIRGRSMEPALCDGDLAFGRGPLRFAPPLRRGMVVLVARQGIGLTVKRLGDPDGAGQFALIGDSPLSAPSVDLGRVGHADVLAVLLWVWRKGRLRRIR